jgi:hypothetical protein
VLGGVVLQLQRVVASVAVLFRVGLLVFAVALCQQGGQQIVGLQDEAGVVLLLLRQQLALEAGGASRGCRRSTDRCDTRQTRLLQHGRLLLASVSKQRVQLELY